MVAERDVLVCRGVKVKSFMIERWFCHHALVEYEYRRTEYDYEFPHEHVMLAR